MNSAVANPAVVNVATDAANADPVDALIRSIRIPPRPSLLTDVQQELAQDDPDPRRIARIIVNDVGMSGALLKLTNSPYIGLRQKATSVEQAINVLGISQCAALLTGLLARQAVSSDAQSLVHFWEVSTKRAQAVVFLAKRFRVCESDIAHTFGLFCDIGVPLLFDRFPDYAATFDEASHDAENRFTQVEDARHMTNHAAIGCLLARNWGLSEHVSSSILLHHDYSAIGDKANDRMVRSLIAISLFAEKAIQKYNGNSNSTEWEKGGQVACDYLALEEEETEELLEELHELFGSGH